MHHDRFRFQTIFTMLYCNVLKITTARVHRPTLPSFSGSSPSPSIRGTLSNDFQLQIHRSSELPALASIHLNPAPTSSPNIHLPNSFPVLRSSRPMEPNLVATRLFGTRSCEEARMLMRGLQRGGTCYLVLLPSRRVRGLV